ARREPKQLWEGVTRGNTPVPLTAAEPEVRRRQRRLGRSERVGKRRARQIAERVPHELLQSGIGGLCMSAIPGQKRVESPRELQRAGAEDPRAGRGDIAHGVRVAGSSLVVEEDR